jgi:hypothetical protein
MPKELAGRMRRIGWPARVSRVDLQVRNGTRPIDARRASFYVSAAANVIELLVAHFAVLVGILAHVILLGSPPIGSVRTL